MKRCEIHDHERDTDLVLTCTECVHDALQKGCDAFFADKSLSTNPYEDDELHEWWIMGWYDAQNDTMTGE